MTKEFQDLSGKAQYAIVDAFLDRPDANLPESVKDEIREWATPPYEKPTEQKIIAATNLLAEYIEKSLPPGWTLTLTMNSEEACLVLEDIDGEDHHDFNSEHDWSGITAAIEYAKEYDTQE